jgi:hypothetical protein
MRQTQISNDDKEIDAASMADGGDGQVPEGPHISATAGGDSGAAYRKPELLLERAGFTHKEIADMLGKTHTAVAKTVSRARAATRSE